MARYNPSNYKKCNYCGKLKSISDFITGVNIKLQITYSQMCKPCRATLEKEVKKTKSSISKIKKDE